MTIPSVDLIIPLFNKKKHIERCIKSAINQKRKFNKIIIVNDGSTDNVEDILKHYSKNFEFIKVIHQDNKGVSVARNVGAKASNADFCVFLDADDELNPFYLLEIIRLISFYKDKKINIFSTRHQSIYTNKKPVLPYIQSKNSLNYTKYSLFKLSYDKTLLCASGICVNRNIFKIFNFPSKIEIGEDIYFWQKILLNEGFAWSNLALVNVYKNSENRAQQINKSFPYYLLKSNLFLENSKNIKYKLSFYLFQITSFFIVINQFKKKNNFKLIEFEKIYQSQDKLINFFIKFFLLNIFHYLYKIIYFLKELLNKINLKAILIYAIITPSSPLIFFIIFFKNEYILSSIFSYYVSLISVVIYIFSFQQRIYLSDSFPKYKLNIIASYRLLISIIILALFASSILFIEYSNLYLLSFTILILLNFWLIEILVLFFEKFKIEKLLNYLLIIKITFYIILIIVPYNEFIFLILTAIIYSIVTIFIFKRILHFSKNNLIKVIKLIINNYGIYFFFSGLLLTFSNYFFKQIFINYYDLKELSFFLMIYTIGTLPSSFYYSVIGQYAVRSTNLQKYYLILSTNLVIISYFIIFFNFQAFELNNFYFLILSIISSVILLIMHYNRAEQITELNKNSFLIYKDFIFYIAVSVAPLLIIYDTSYEKYIFLIIATVGLLTYQNYKKYPNNK